MDSNGLNICFIGHFTAGGTERATFLVANGLCNKYNIHIINTCNDNPTFELDERVGFDYLKSGNVITQILALKQYLRLKNIDILVSVESMLGIITVPATTMAHCKHVVWEHANYYQKNLVINGLKNLCIISLMVMFLIGLITLRCAMK